MLKCTINYMDGSTEEYIPSVENFDGYVKYTVLDNLEYDKISSIDFNLHEFEIKEGDAGYYLLPGGAAKTVLFENAIGYFKKRENIVWENIDAFMPILGVVHEKESFLGVITGMPEQCMQRVIINDGTYKFSLRVETFGKAPYDIISMVKLALPSNADYSKVAGIYRSYLLNNGFVALKDKLTPELKYAAESLYIRVRLAWKPAPSPVEDQTPETEPPLYVACTFEDVERIMRSYKEAGVEKAEFCLVGWNSKGHDGRWPQVFPVEEELGGEEGLRKLIAEAHRLGYNITCHTNSKGAYTIANNFNEDDIIRNEDGSLNKIEHRAWSGGRTHFLCAKRAYEMALEVLPKVADLGFRGVHYIDSITTLKAKPCYSPKHPLTVKESYEYYDKILAFAKKQFGGISSESGYQYALKNCDMIFYLSYLKPINSDVAVIDEYIPFWQLVFHGITMIGAPNSMYMDCSHPTKEHPEALMKTLENGGRPLLYYYKKFTGEPPFINEINIDTEEDLKRTTSYAKALWDAYKELSYLQYEFMDKHEKIADNIYRVTYSDGSYITFDYNNNTYKLTKSDK